MTTDYNKKKKNRDIISFFDDILKEARESASTEYEKSIAGTEKVSGEAPIEVCQLVLEGIKEDAGKGATVGNTFSATAILLQKGATSPRTPGGTKIAFGTAEVTVDVIRKHCKKNKITVRQFARGLKEKIMEFLLILGDNAPEGNQARSFRLENKNVTREEAIWASDFNTYHEGCPERVKAWLIYSYRRRFRTDQSQY